MQPTCFALALHIYYIILLLAAIFNLRPIYICLVHNVAGDHMPIISYIRVLEVEQLCVSNRFV